MVKKKSKVDWEHSKIVLKVIKVDNYAKQTITFIDAATKAKVEPVEEWPANYDKQKYQVFVPSYSSKMRNFHRFQNANNAKNPEKIEYDHDEGDGY